MEAEVLYPTITKQYSKLTMKAIDGLHRMVSEHINFPIVGCPHLKCKESKDRIYKSFGELGSHYRDEHLKELLEAQTIPKNNNFRVQYRGLTDLMITHDLLKDKSSTIESKEEEQESIHKPVDVPVKIANKSVSSYKELSELCREGKEYKDWKRLVWQEELSKTGHQEVLCGHCGKYATQIHHANPLEDFNSILMRVLRIDVQTDAITVLKDEELKQKVIRLVGEYHLFQKPRVWFVCVELHDLCTTSIDGWRKKQR